MPLSLLDTAFALDAPSGRWSLKDSVGKDPTTGASRWPPALRDHGWISVRRLAARFSDAGAALRSLSNSNRNVWLHIHRDTVVREIRERLRDPMIIDQDPTGLCGPLSIVVELARRDPREYVRVAQELLETGHLRCTGGRDIVAYEDLRLEPVASGDIGEVDWLIAATMRDDENIIEDVEDDASGWEAITTWTEQAGWIRDVLRLSFARCGFDLGSNEIHFMRAAQDAVNAGGVAFFLIDSNLLRNGGTDDEEPISWRSSQHRAGQQPSGFGITYTHSMDDELPPDHWVIYLGGLDLGPDPDDSDLVVFRVWSWGREYEVTGTVDAFAEYLYGFAAAPV